MSDVYSKPHSAVVGRWRFVCRPTYVLGDTWSYGFFAIPGRKTVSKLELELWAKLELNKEVYYTPE